MATFSIFSLIPRNCLNFCVNICSKDKGLVVHVSASKHRLLELADEIGFSKQTTHGMRIFNIGCLDDFLYKGMT